MKARFSLVFLLIIFSASQLLGDEEALIPPVLLHNEDALMPLILQDNRIRDPKATVRVSISAAGTVTDALCLYADDYRMAEKAESLALGYQFKPAYENGKPIAVHNDVVINFTYESSYNTSKDGFNNMVDFIDKDTASINRLSTANPNELDTPLKIVESAKPLLVKNEAGEVELGKALIEGYVNYDGRFRFLSVKSSDSPYIAEAAIENFKQLKFTPPRKDEQRVVCRVQIPFVAQEQ